MHLASVDRRKRRIPASIATLDLSRYNSITPVECRNREHLSPGYCNLHSIGDQLTQSIDKVFHLIKRIQINSALFLINHFNHYMLLAPEQMHRGMNTNLFSKITLSSFHRGIIPYNDVAGFYSISSVRDSSELGGFRGKLGGIRLMAIALSKLPDPLPIRGACECAGPACSALCRRGRTSPRVSR